MGKRIAVCVLLCLCVCALLLPPVSASGLTPHETAGSEEVSGEAVGGTLVLPPPPSSEHGLCGGAYCETSSETTPNPATGAVEVGSAAAVALLCGAAALALPLLLLLLLRRDK